MCKEGVLCKMELLKLFLRLKSCSLIKNILQHHNSTWQPKAYPKSESTITVRREGREFGLSL